MTTSTENKAIERPDWLPERAWPFEIRSVDIDGTTIAYTDEGSGPVLLLVHDGMWSYVWGQLIAELRNDYRIVTLDLPGSGLSPANDESLPGLEADSRLVERLAEELNLEAVTIVVHDLGGSVGLGFAARRPELVDGMVLINTFAWPADSVGLRAMFRVMTSAPVRAINVGTNLVPRLTSGRFGIGRHLDEPARRAFRDGFKDRAPRGRFHDMMAAARDETHYLSWVEHSLRTVLLETPVLTIFGEKNDPFGFQERFRTYFDDVEEMVVPHGNHFPMTDDPSGVANRIAEWHRAKLGV